jgi:hypothetical protein
MGLRDVGLLRSAIAEVKSAMSTISPNVCFRTNRYSYTAWMCLNKPKEVRIETTVRVATFFYRSFMDDNILKQLGVVAESGEVAVLCYVIRPV